MLYYDDKLKDIINGTMQKSLLLGSLSYQVPNCYQGTMILNDNL